MRFRTLFELIEGKRDLRSLKVLNLLFGKRVLFVERPHETFPEIERYIQEQKVKKVYLLTPENWVDEIRRTSKISKKNFERVFERVVSLLKRNGIKIVLHLHLTPTPQELSFKYKFERTKRALKYLERLGIAPKEVAYGWWRKSHRDKDLEIVAKKLGLKLAKREFHVYDYWLK